MDLYKLTAHELHDKLVKKEISSVELTENVYSRIDEVEDKVQAYVTLDKENALAQAAKVDAKIAAGEEIAPLAGIPGAIKDNICTKGLLTTCSSKMLANVVPIYDAHVISKLRADDAIFTGKTNMEWALPPKALTSIKPTIRGTLTAYRAVLPAAALLLLPQAKQSGALAPIPAVPSASRLLLTAALALNRLTAA